MEKLTKKQYYATDRDTYLDDENVADCKCQIRIDEFTIYGLDDGSDEFFVASESEEFFLVDATLEQVKLFLIDEPAKTTEELKNLLKDKILSYKQEDFRLFVNESGWEDWMNDYTEAGDGEEISEKEGEEIEAIQWEVWKSVWDEYNSMDEYSIKDAISSAGGSPEGIEYSDYYIDWHDFRAESKEDAIRIAEELQSRHDQAMKDSPEFQALSVSKQERALTNAPCYAQCLELSGERVEV